MHDKTFPLGWNANSDLPKENSARLTFLNRSGVRYELNSSYGPYNRSGLRAKPQRR